MKKKKPIKIRNRYLEKGPLTGRVRGTKKGKRGYKRSDNKRIARDEDRD